MGQDRTITINNKRYTIETREVPTFTINKLRETETELESPARRGHWQKFEHGIHVRSRDIAESRSTDEKCEIVEFNRLLAPTVTRHSTITFFFNFTNFLEIGKKKWGKTLANA